MDDYRLRHELRRGIESLCRRRGDLLTETERTRITEEIIDDTLGLGPLEPLLRDPTISDILINGPNTIFVERRGQLEQASISFHDADHLVQIVQRIAGKVGRRLDESSPMVDARMSDGSRVNAVIGPLALDGALVSIRRFGDRRLQASDLIGHRALTGEMWDFLSTCVATGLNVIVSGGTGSGKSTLMNALCSAIPANQRIVTIEDAAELNIHLPHVARMETRCANVEGKGEITARDLVRNALRMRPDRIIIGECRGSEAFDMLQAMTTGHDGSLTTLHSNGPRSALRRLEMLVGMAGMELPAWFIRELVGSAVQIIVQCVRLPNGQRKVTSISEVTGVVGETVSLHDIFEYKRQDTDPTTGKTGYFRTTGIRPVCLDRLATHGARIDPSFFEERILRVDRCDTIPRLAAAPGRSTL
ncbi:CpaF family protein [Fuerstiella marisgermanici]|uniref:Conjugal transfer protein n=1 Tax=Fuerstiella marisgermanici TaxID=1891926 RepID=A0A1P8WMX5_9PLAN|nr:CpaF family protein [Fuerstiella marisgermanici]APZ95398.1 Putative conjugal transfer protein [Fuerstiella marisgermanici]